MSASSLSLERDSGAACIHCVASCVHAASMEISHVTLGRCYKERTCRFVIAGVQSYSYLASQPWALFCCIRTALLSIMRNLLTPRELVAAVIRCMYVDSICQPACLQQLTNRCVWNRMLCHACKRYSHACGMKFVASKLDQLTSELGTGASCSSLGPAPEALDSCTYTVAS